jgi:hypothetical protein
MINITWAIREISLGRLQGIKDDMIKKDHGIYVDMDRYARQTDKYLLDQGTLGDIKYLIFLKERDYEDFDRLWDMYYKLTGNNAGAYAMAESEIERTRRDRFEALGY